MAIHFSSPSSRLLLVEPERRLQLALAAASASLAEVEIFESFMDARARLVAARFNLVVANLRLGPYNGIHLAYEVHLSGVSAHVVVHASERDAVAARDIQRAGAFFERTERLSVTLPAYLQAASLPAFDRRDSARFDRRRQTRGGRRAWDKRPSDGNSKA